MKRKKEKKRRKRVTKELGEVLRKKGDVVKPPKGCKKTDQDPPACWPLERMEARVTAGRIDKEDIVSHGDGNHVRGR